MRAPHTCTGCWSALNESPSQKEGKWSHRRDHYVPQWRRLNEILHLKVLNKQSCGHLEGILICLIESPYKTVGKFLHRRNTLMILLHASIKVPPHRREQLIIYTWLTERMSPQCKSPLKSGEIRGNSPAERRRGDLNESPYEKAGKSHFVHLIHWMHEASMKALPKRKGNGVIVGAGDLAARASMKAPPKGKGNLPQIRQG